MVGVMTFVVWRKTVNMLNNYIASIFRVDGHLQDTLNCFATHNITI